VSSFREGGWGLRIALIAASVGVAWLLSPFASTILAAVVVVMVTWPVFAWIRARVGGRPGVATFLTMLLLVVGVVGPVGCALWVVIAEMGELLVGMRDSLTGLPERASVWLDRPEVAALYRKVTADVRPPSQALVDTLHAAVNPALKQAGTLAQAALNNLGAAVLRLLLFLLVLGSLFHGGPGFAERAQRLLPVAADVQARVWDRLSRFARGFVVAALLVAVLQGTLAWMGYSLGGVDRPLVWGILTGIVSVVPVAGTALVWIPLAVVRFAQGDSSGGVIVLAWSILVVGSADNFVRPLVIGRSASVHPTLIFLAVFGGLATLGLSGLLIGPMLMATLLALLQLYEESLGAGGPGGEASIPGTGGVPPVTPTPDTT
jgi:predicted PurR-regulated permease PerM